MLARRTLLLFLLPFLLAAKTDRYEQVSPADRAVLHSGLERYVQDQITANWSDLFEIKIPGYAIQTDYDDLSGKTPLLSKEDFVATMSEGVSNGSRPVLQSFDLRSITPMKGGYEIRACSKAQRESFHFQGIVKFTAYISDGRVQFGSWVFVVSMPHSCSQKEDSE
jgi:hypothetical protein